MPLIATLLERRIAVQSFRRALSRNAGRVVTCRSPAHLDQLLSRQLVDVVVLGAAPAKGPVLEALRQEFPAIPLMLYAPLRSEDAELLVRVHRERLVGLVIEGIDEPVLVRRVLGHGLTARRVASLGGVAARLDLVDALQQRAWQEIVAGAPGGMSTAALARRLGVSRETLSRRFAAGGGPSLKSAMDAVRLFAAGQLLGNPAYRVEDVARLLGFSSVSLLQRTARRIFGIPAKALGELGDNQWVAGVRGGAGRGDWE